MSIQKTAKRKFTLEEYQADLSKIDIKGLLPFLEKSFRGPVLESLIDTANKGLARDKSILGSMTRFEKQNPDILDEPRLLRIAKGSGSTLDAVHKLLKGFQDWKKLMQKLTRPRNGKPTPPTKAGAIPIPQEPLMTNAVGKKTA